MSEKTELASILAEIRAKHGYSQRSLASFLQVSPSSVQNVEDGKTRFPFTHIKALWPLLDNLDKEVIRHALYRQVDDELS